MSRDLRSEGLDGPRVARRTLEEMRVGALWLHCAAVLTAEEPDGPFTLPFLHIDPEGRADVADVPGAVHRERLSGSADVTWRFVFLPNAAEGVMDVEISVPVRCRFRVAISARAHRSVLEQVVDAGMIALATTCPQGVADVPQTIWIRLCSVEAVRLALARCG
jgi:hypothetical protein